MARVVTTDGALLVPPKNRPTLTPKAAQSRCDEANRRAEALGIKTRYEVRD